jgi:hypothetical protein
MDIFQLVQKINNLEQENKEYREALERFRQFPKPYIEVCKVGLFPVMAHAETVLDKYTNDQTAKQ